MKKIISIYNPDYSVTLKYANNLNKKYVKLFDDTIKEARKKNINLFELEVMLASILHERFIIDRAFDSFK